VLKAYGYHKPLILLVYKSEPEYEKNIFGNFDFFVSALLPKGIFTGARV
jgi:hypothetical protein